MCTAHLRPGISLMRFGRAPISQTHSLCGCPESRGRKCLCLLEMGPSFLLSAAVRPAALLLTILFCMSQVLPGNKRNFAEALLRIQSLRPYGQPVVGANSSPPAPRAGGSQEIWGPQGLRPAASWLMVPPSSSQLDGVRSGVFQVLKTLFATSLKVDLIRQVYPQFLDLDNQRKWGILLGNLGFRSPPLTCSKSILRYFHKSHTKAGGVPAEGRARGSPWKAFSSLRRVQPSAPSYCWSPALDSCPSRLQPNPWFFFLLFNI